MDAREALALLQARLARALRADDPPAALAAGAELREELPDELPDELRSLVGRVAPDGLRITALLVAKLRFERLVQGSRRAGDWFARDARGFAAAFRRYHSTVPPHALDPSGEALAFDRWLDA